MASAVASKGTPLAGLLRKLLAAQSGAPTFAYALRPASVAGTRRLFNSEGSALGRFDDDNMSSRSEDDDAVDDRRRAHGFSDPMFFSTADVFEPFGAPKTLGKLLEEALPAARAMRGSPAAPWSWWWLAKEDDHAATLKVPIPGLGKEHDKVRADRNTLVIKGDGGK